MSETTPEHSETPGHEESAPPEGAESVNLTELLAGLSDEQRQALLGEGGKKALRDEREAAKKARRERDALADKVREFEDAQKSETERLSEQVNAAQAKAEALRSRAVRAEVRALAAERFADPEDAAAFLDLASFVDEDGEVDPKAISAALAELLKRKPHLGKAETGPRRPAHDASQGSSGNSNRTTSDGDVFAGFLNQRLGR